jgi:glycine dehydrogenase subunit 2
MAYNRLIFELSSPGRKGYELSRQGFHDDDVLPLDSSLFREHHADLPEVSELDIVRHYTKVSQKNIGIESGFYPLGSCTMKYNPKINDEMASLDGFRNIHPLQPISTVQPLLKLYHETATMLNEITGMAGTTLNTFAWGTYRFDDYETLSRSSWRYKTNQSHYSRFRSRDESRKCDDAWL